MSIGESNFRVTLHRLSQFIAAIGNRGFSPGPHPARILREQTSQQLQSAMLGTVNIGTASGIRDRLGSLGHLGGKTGSGPGDANPTDGIFAALVFDSTGAARYSIVTYVPPRRSRWRRSSGNFRRHRKISTQQQSRVILSVRLSLPLCFRASLHPAFVVPAVPRHTSNSSSPQITPEAPMEKRQLGSSDLYITPIGFGAWAIGGGGWDFGWGAQDDNDSIAAIHELSISASIGSTPPPFMASATPRKSSPARSQASPAIGHMSSPNASGFGTNEREIRQVPRKPIRFAANAKPACGACKIDAIDLYQIHWPAARRRYRRRLARHWREPQSRRGKSATSASRISTSRNGPGPENRARSLRSSRRIRCSVAMSNQKFFRTRTQIISASLSIRRWPPAC